MLGLASPFNGPGCTDQPPTSFFPGEAYCTSLGAARVASTNSNNKKDLISTKKNLCHPNRKVTRGCRADQVLGKCVCPYNVNNSVIPRCNSYSQPVCSSSKEAVCSNSSNILFCAEQQLLCIREEAGFVDLVDKVYCRKK